VVSCLISIFAEDRVLEWMNRTKLPQIDTDIRAENILPDIGDDNILLWMNRTHQQQMDTEKELKTSCLISEMIGYLYG
jgi:hypothetical protein